MTNFELKFKKEELEKYAIKYEYPTDKILDEIKTSAREKNYLTKDEFLKICAWKTPRSKPRCASNSEDFIKEVTRIALTTTSDQLRIEVLTLLKGVGWPTASTILHFCHKEEFPILDFRALYSIGIDNPPTVYYYSFWRDYTEYCRNLGNSLNLDLRTIDRGLWQFSKKTQATDKK